MNYFRPIICQTLIFSIFNRLGQCEEFDYNWELEVVYINYGTEERSWESVSLSKYKSSDRFIFQNNELDQICGGPFSSSNVEIMEIFNRVFSFSLIRERSRWIVNSLFSEDSSVQEFFREIRSQQRAGYARDVQIDKLFKYATYQVANNEDPLQLLSHHVKLQMKYLSSRWFPNPRSFYFAHRGIHLVLLSKTFNISEILTSNKFVLCSESIITHVFILRFLQNWHANSFYEFIKHDLNAQIPCSADWVPYEVIQQVNSG